MPKSPEKIDQDPHSLSRQAFQSAKAKGHFKDLQPGTLVAYSAGKLVATARNWDQLMLERHRQGLVDELFVEQV